MVGQKDTHATKAKTILPETLITGAAETTDGNAAAVPRQSMWSSKLLIGKIRKNHSGRNSFLAPIENVLLGYVFENREQGIQVTTRMIRKYVEKKLPLLLQKMGKRTARQFAAFSTKLA